MIINKKQILKKASAFSVSLVLLFTMSCKSEDKNKGTTQKLGIIYLWQSQMCAKNNPFPNGGSVTSAVNVSPSPASGSDYNYGYINAGGADYVIHKKTIQKISSTGALSDFVGSTSSTASTDGTGTSAGFVSITSWAADSAGNIFVIDTITFGSSLALRKITPAGVVTTPATYIVSGSNRILVYIAIDSSDNIYVYTRNGYTDAVTIQKAATSTLSFSAYYSSSDPTFYSSVSVNSHGNTMFADKKGNLYIMTSSGLQILNSSLQLSKASFASSFGSSTSLQFDSSGNAYFTGSVGDDRGIVKADSSGNTTMLLRATSAIGMACNTPGYGAYGINLKSTGEIQGYGNMASSYYGLNAAVDYTKYYLFTYKQP